MPDLTTGWPPPCPKCGKQQLVIGGVPDFPGEGYASTMSLACPDWPERCDMVPEEPHA